MYLYIYIYINVIYIYVSHATSPTHSLVYISDFCNAIVNVKWWPVTRPARSLRVRKLSLCFLFCFPLSTTNTTTTNQKKHGRSISAAAGFWTIRTAPCTGKTSPSRRECTPGIRHHESWGPRLNRSFPNGGFAYATLWYFMTLYEDCDYQPWHFGLQYFCWYPPVN